MNKWITRFAFPWNGAGSGFIAAIDRGAKASVSSEASAILPRPMPQSRRKWRRGMWGTDCMTDHQATLPLRQPKLHSGKSRPSPSLLCRQPLDGINDNMAVGAGVGDFHTALSVCDFEIAEREPQSIDRR